MGIKLDCPECGKRMTFDLANTRVYCSHCGHVRSTGLDEKVAEVRQRGPRPEVPVSNVNEVHPRALSLFYTAHDQLYAGDRVQALVTLGRALEIQADFMDAHLWVAKLSPDDSVKREHLSTILAYNPGHLEAMRMLMVLNGRMTPEEAERSRVNEGPTVMRADGPVATQQTILRCPSCGGDLTVDDQTGRVLCRFCGYTAAAAPLQGGQSEQLTAAMLQRRAQSVKWIVGERVLHCNACGAERMIGAEVLSARCPFCGSNQVIEQDVLGSFEQPDGVIPFQISREEAGERIKERLRGLTERVKGWFTNNKVKSATLEGFYLPFWLFDAMGEVTRTRIDNRMPKERRMPTAPSYQQQKFSDAVYDIEVCAVQSPPRSLTAQLDDYHSGALVAYDPSLLAKYPAQIYMLDFDKAALEARGVIAAQMRSKYQGIETSDEVSVHVTTLIQQMSFRLVLLPVWVSTLVEEDNDRRMALVSGQSGKVVLGNAVKAPKSK